MGCLMEWCHQRNAPIPNHLCQMIVGVFFQFAQKEMGAKVRHTLMLPPATNFD